MARRTGHGSRQAQAIGLSVDDRSDPKGGMEPPSGRFFFFFWGGGFYGFGGFVIGFFLLVFYVFGVL